MASGGWTSRDDADFINFSVDVRGCSTEALDHALRIALLAAHNQVAAYRIVASQLLMYRAGESNRTPFTRPLDANAAVQFATEWLSKTPRPEWVDVSESCVEGWRVVADGGDWELVFALESYWLFPHGLVK